MGFTVPEVDKILAPYAEKSYMKYFNEYLEIADDIEYEQPVEIHSDKACAYAISKVKENSNKVGRVLNTNLTQSDLREEITRLSR